MGRPVVPPTLVAILTEGTVEPVLSIVPSARDSKHPVNVHGSGGNGMEQPAGELGEGSGRAVGAMGVGDGPDSRGSYHAVHPDLDACIAGRQTPTFDVDHRGLFSDVRLHDVVDVLHDIEAFVRRNPWPILALGFAAGYLLSRSKVR